MSEWGNHIVKFIKSIPQNDNRKLRYCVAASKDFTATAKLILMDFSLRVAGGWAETLELSSLGNTY